MAHEQLCGGRIDVRTDIFASGVTLYELLAGRLPYEHVGDDQCQPLEDVRPEVGPVVARIVHRAFAKRPDDRFQTPEAMRSALELLVTDATASSAPARTDLEQPRSAKPVVDFAGAEAWGTLGPPAGPLHVQLAAPSREEGSEAYVWKRVD